MIKTCIICYGKPVVYQIQKCTGPKDYNEKLRVNCEDAVT